MVNFSWELAPPVPNTNTIAPICPYDSHLVGSKCVINGAGCPPGTVQDDGDITCSPKNQFPGSGWAYPNYDGTCPTRIPTSFNGRCYDQLPVIPGGKLVQVGVLSKCCH